MSRRAGLLVVMLSFIPSLLIAGSGRWLVKGCFSKLKLKEQQRLQLAVQGYIEQAARRTRQALSGLVASEKVDRLLVEVSRQEVETGRIAFLARQWAQEYGLEVLLMADGSGRILSCANLPARAGEAEESLRHLAGLEGELDLVLSQPLLHQGTVTQKPAWLTLKRRTFENTVLIFLAGFFIDQPWLEELKKISGAVHLDLIEQPNVPATQAEGVVRVDLPSPPLENFVPKWLEITAQDLGGYEKSLLLKLYLLAAVFWVAVSLLLVFYNRSR